MDFRVLRMIPLVISGSWFAFQLHKSFREFSLTDGILLLFIGVTGLIFFLRTIFRDRKEYKETRDISEYIPTITGLCFILCISAMAYYQDKRMSAPTLVSAFYDGGFNGVSIDFKVDGNYILSNGSRLSQSYSYGTYVIADSVITLDKVDIDDVIRSKTFVLRHSEYYLPIDSIRASDSTRANYITQTDTKGNEIDDKFRLRVIKDNRR